MKNTKTIRKVIMTILALVLAINITPLGGANAADQEVKPIRLKNKAELFALNETTKLDYLLPDVYIYDPETATPEEIVFYESIMALVDAEVARKTNLSNSVFSTMESVEAIGLIPLLNGGFYKSLSRGNQGWKVTIPSEDVPPGVPMNGVEITIRTTVNGVVFSTTMNYSTSGTITNLPTRESDGKPAGTLPYYYIATFSGGIAFGSGGSTFFLGFNSNNTLYFYET